MAEYRLKDPKSNYVEVTQSEITRVRLEARGYKQVAAESKPVQQPVAPVEAPPVARPATALPNKDVAPAPAAPVQANAADPNAQNPS